MLSNRLAYQTAVNRRPVNLTLTRITQEDDGAGGISETIEEIPVTVRLSIPVKRETVLTDAGFIVKKEISFLGTYRADIKTGDLFTMDGQQYRVSNVVPDCIRGDILGVQGTAEAIPA